MMKVRWLIAAAVLAMAFAVPAEAQFFFDNFDSYAPGSMIAGQGGWETWGGDPGADAMVVNTISFSSPNSLAVSGTADVVHTFNVTSGYWYAKVRTFVPSGQTGDLYFIILNLFDGFCANAGDCNWSIQVRLSATDGVVENVGGSDNPDGTAVPIFLDQWIEVRAEIDLAGNVAYIYYNDALMTVQQYNVTGANAIAAFDLFSDASSESYMDDVWLDTTIPVELMNFDVE
jgi:hypothetical protein